MPFRPGRDECGINCLCVTMFRLPPQNFFRCTEVRKYFFRCGTKRSGGRFELLSHNGFYCSQTVTVCQVINTGIGRIEQLAYRHGNNLVSGLGTGMLTGGEQQKGQQRQSKKPESAGKKSGRRVHG